MIRTYLAERKAARLTHREAAVALRRMAASGGTVTAMLATARRAMATAPDDRTAVQYLHWIRPLAEGRKVRTKRFRVRFLEPVPRELEEAVEEALIEVNDDGNDDG